MNRCHDSTLVPSDKPHYPILAFKVRILMRMSGWGHFAIGREGFVSCTLR